MYAVNPVTKFYFKPVSYLKYKFYSKFGLQKLKENLKTVLVSKARNIKLKKNVRN